MALFIQIEFSLIAGHTIVVTLHIIGLRFSKDLLPNLIPRALGYPWNMKLFRFRPSLVSPKVFKDAISSS